MMRRLTNLERWHQRGCLPWRLRFSSAVVFGWVLALLLMPRPAAAHREEFPKRDQLVVTPDHVTLTIEYLIPTDEEAAVLRRLFDRDRSGSLDADEQQNLLLYLCTQATAFLRLSVDERPIALQQERSQLLPLSESKNPLMAVITLTAPLSLKRGRHHLHLVDRHKDRHILVPLRLSAPSIRILSPLPPLPLVNEAHPLDLQLDRPD
jgi:hypothetical protein